MTEETTYKDLIRKLTSYKNPENIVGMAGFRINTKNTLFQIRPMDHKRRIEGTIRKIIF